MVHHHNFVMLIERAFGNSVYIQAFGKFFGIQVPCQFALPTVQQAKCNGQGMLTLAERLRAEVAATRFHHREQTLPVTISAGVCSISKSGSINELLKQADVQLYNAKESGRNRISPRVRSQDTGSSPQTPA